MISIPKIKNKCVCVLETWWLFLHQNSGFKYIISPVPKNRFLSKKLGSLQLLNEIIVGRLGLRNLTIEKYSKISHGNKEEDIGYRFSQARFVIFFWGLETLKGWPLKLCWSLLQSMQYLVGGFNPFEKYDRQIGSFPQVGVKIKNIWNHHLVMVSMLKESKVYLKKNTVPFFF